MNDDLEHGQELSLSLGQQLKMAREHAKLSLEEIEGTLHVSGATLRDIENDSVDQGVNPLFTKGYIKSYAGLVGMDKEEALELYAVQYSDDVSVKKMQTFSNRTKLKEHNNYLNYVSWLIVLLLGATIVGWWYQQATTDTREQPIESTSFNDAELSTADDSIIPQNVATNTQPLAAQARFIFSEDCWIKVTDAANEIIAIGIKKQGSTLIVSGVPPFEVNLGAPNAVKIVYQGNELDITPYINGQTARFSVPLDKEYALTISNN